MGSLNSLKSFEGTAWCVGDNVSTDEILPGRYMTATDRAELARNALAGVKGWQSGQLQDGDILVGGENFGTGSSRESAARALKYTGFGAIIAESFARIFYRNCINIGLPVFWVAGIRDIVRPGDRVYIDAINGTIANRTTGVTATCLPLPPFVLKIVEHGGLAAYARTRTGNSLVDIHGGA